MKEALHAFRNHSALLVILIPLFLYAKESFPLASIITVLFFWKLRTKDHSWLLVFLLCLCFLIPRTSQALPSMQQGRILSVRKNYAVAGCGREKVILYTNEKPLLDSTISFSPDYQEIESSSGFYRFDFASYCHRQGIYYASSIDSFQTVKEPSSLRGRMMQRILKIQDEEKRNLLLEILLGIRRDENTLESFLKDSGFSIAGIILLIESILKYVLSEEKKKNVMLVITGFFCLFTHLAYLPLLRLLSLLSGKTRLTGRERTCFSLILSLLIHPEAAFSASFLLPAVFRIVPLFTNHSKAFSFTLSMCMQSLLFQAVNPVQMLLYRYCMGCSGMLWLLALLSIVLPVPVEQAVHTMDNLLSLLNPFTINGSILGPGLPLFFLMLFTFRRAKHFHLISACVFLLFDLTGMFHPFAEVVFINVGQGDSIYLQEPFGFHAALVDTGKPGAWNSVDTMLKAHGQRKLDTLIITHGDNDHSGNQQKIIDSYSPHQVITTHHKRIACGRIVFQDLNEIHNQNENASSIVTLVQLNHMKLLLTGDADSSTEKQIIRKYANLHADVLKLSHHGSKTGSSEDFLNQVKPDLAIISCGSYSIYHHPSPQTMQRLEERHIPSLDTLTQGDIAIFCIGPWNVFLTSEGKMGMVS